MNKELSPITIQNNLWGKIGGKEGITSRIQDARKGHLPSGLALSELIGNEKRFAAILGEFAPRVLIASDPNNPMSLLPEQIAVAGGWCALRTNDVKNITAKDPIIVNPLTGAIEPVTSTEQVAQWMQESVSFDQIVESIGAVNASEYAVISEQRLWTERMVTKLSQIFNRRLSSLEQETIASSIANAEQIRAEMTSRYIQYVTGNNDINFIKIVDEDIWKDIRYAQTDMLSRVGLSVPRLQKMFPQDAETIKTSALVWAMYSEPYFNVLRDNGYITKPTVFVVEPSLHTYPDTRPGKEVVQRIYQDKGIYFDTQGINKNTGFIAFMECVTPNGKNVRKALSVGEVPNISNWQNLFSNSGVLNPDRNSVINLTDNLLFVWGVNLLPFGTCRQKLLDLGEIQQRFQEEKALIGKSFVNSAKKDPTVQTNIRNKTEELRQEMLRDVNNTNIAIAQELKNLFVFLTKGLL